MSTLAVLVGGFASGVFLRSLVVAGSELFLFALLLAFIFVGAAFLANPADTLGTTPTGLAWSLAAIFCVALALGGFRAGLAESSPPDLYLADLKQRVTYEGIVVSDPDVRDANQRVTLLVTKEGTRTKMLAVAPRSESVMVEDTVTVFGTLALPEPFADEGGRIFRYDKYLERDGVRFLLNFASIRVEQEAPRHSIPAALARVKHAFVGGLQAALPEPHASLASGIVIGGKSGLGTELKDAFTRSGLVHVVVLSGHNVMIVASWVIALFAFLFAKVETVSGRRVPRGASIGLGALALVLFVGIAGVSSTAVRAALMALIALYARATGRTYAAGRALFVVVLLMLLWNPLYLAFDPGFGLSVAATAGLIWLAPGIETWFDPTSRPRLLAIKNRFLKNAVATTLAAQISVLPLLLYQTGNLSIVAFPANILAAPIVPLTMAFAALAGAGGMLIGSAFPFLALLLGAPVYLTTALLIGIAKASAAFPMAVFALPAFPFLLTLALYVLLIYATARLNRSSATPQLMFAKKAST